MNDVVLHPGQEAVIDSKARFLAAICGAQAGKTTVGSIWMCNEIWQKHEAGLHGDWLITAPTVKILGQSTLPKFKGFYPPDWGPWKENKSEFELPWENPETRQPCKIYVRSADDPNLLEGMTLMGAWLDEAGLMDSNVWVNMQARLAKNKGRVILTTTPYASKWIKREFSDRARNGDSDYAVFSWASNANPAFPPEEWDRLKKTLPEAIFRRRHMGEFVTMEGLVYPDFDRDRDVIDSFSVPDSWKRFGGLDFGHSQPTAIVCVAEDPQTHTCYIYREFYRKESLLKEIANFLASENMAYVLADPQGAQAISELNRFYGRGEVRAADNKVDIGIERIATMFKEGRLKIFKTCENTIAEVEEYHYPAPDSDKADKADKPVKKNDHLMDASKYAFSRQIQSVYPLLAQRRSNLKARLASRRPNTYDY